MNPFTDSFFLNALFMVAILSLLFGILSFFIVIRKMSFIGAGIAHTAFGGAALGFFLGISPFATSIIFCIITAIIIVKMTKKTNVSYDTGIGIFFAFSMALGILFVSLKKEYNFDLMGYLFGNILGVHALDILLALGILVAFIGFNQLFMRRLIFISFDSESAQSAGIAVSYLETILLAFLVAIIVVSIKMVGIILVTSLVVLPASFGLLFFKHYKHVIWAGIFFSLITMMGGLAISWFVDIPSGASMVILSSLVYFISLPFQKK